MLRDKAFTREQTLPLGLYDYSWQGDAVRLTLEMLAAAGMLAGVEACV